MKPSDIEWIGDIPDDWEVRKITTLLDNIGSGTTPPNNTDFYENGIIPWLNTGDLTDNYVDLIENKITEYAVNQYSALKIFPKDSVVIAMYGATIGKLGILRESASTNQACCVMQCNDNLYFKFLFYSLYGYREYILTLSYGSGQPNISQKIIKDLRLPTPPIKTQRLIADYLDEKCGEIDATIAKQKESIEKLKAYKQSLISETVTKGLDKSAPLKPSGIDYLGDIPSHWEIRKLKFLVALIDNKTKDGRSISLENVESGTGKLIETENTYDGDGISFKENDLLFGKLRPYLAKVYLSALKGRALGDFYVMRANKGINPNFLKFVLLSDWFIKIVDSSTYGTKMPRASWDFTGGMRIPLPPISEQDCISSYLETKYSEVETFIVEKQNIIQKLDAYKKSLIFECVTGKQKN